MPGRVVVEKLRRTPANIPDLLRVAEIRNAGREWFTGDTEEIPPAAQIVWFCEEPRDLWVARIDGEVVGFALLSDRDGKTWIGLGVDPAHQGKGIGTCLYARFFDVWAEIREDNWASRKAAAKAGYRVVSEGDGKVVMHQ